MKKIKSFVSDVLKNQNKFEKIRVKKLTEKEVEFLNVATGFDLMNYTRVLDKSGIKHVFRNHGDVATEKRRGNVAITKADFDLLFKIWNTKNIIKSGKDKLGNQTITYMKEIQHQYYFVEEIRTKGKELALKTFYKKKG